MKTLNQQHQVANLATKPLNINLNRSNVGETIGSVAWLLQQIVEVNFAQKTFDDVTFRYAQLSIGEASATIATDGAYLYEEAPACTARHGYHRVDLPFESPYQQELLFAVPLSPAAVRIVERIAALARDEFKKWIEEDGADEHIEIVLKTQTSK